MQSLNAPVHTWAARVRSAPDWSRPRSRMCLTHLHGTSRMNPSAAASRGVMNSHVGFYDSAPHGHCLMGTYVPRVSAIAVLHSSNRNKCADRAAL
eukprot:3149534-Prymnesium_polylepis.1